MKRLTFRPQIDHRQVSAALRAQPGHWLPVGEYRSTEGANTTARLIRTAYQNPNRARSSYTPAGAYEARVERTEFGARVEARFVGTRRSYLLSVLEVYGRPVTVQLAERLMCGSPWPSAGRNTCRKDLRALAGRGLLTAMDAGDRRIYLPQTIGKDVRP
ncbi:hypothetical protein [Streptomyces sp. NPDC059597]|uniref:hypothetical protein n=1 Tax=Streptomyces sp. NPDC059597 TaxID=3346879 RepID=UPI0036762C34